MSALVIRVAAPVHDFRESLATEQVDSRRPETKALLKLFFPTARGLAFETDLSGQKRGVDVTLRWADENVRDVTLDFKFRKPEDNYPDFSIEFLSTYADGRTTIGWAMDETKTCDFILYIFKSDWTGWLLPRPGLFRAINLHFDDWKARFGIRESKNKTNNAEWVTKFIPVPFAEMLSKVAGVQCSNDVKIKQARAGTKSVIDGKTVEWCGCGELATQTLAVADHMNHPPPPMDERKRYCGACLPKDSDIPI